MSQLASISNRLTTAQSQLLERSRVISLGMVPSASSTTQILRTLTTVKSELSKIADEAELERAGLVVGGNNSKRSTQLDADEKTLDELGERYDRLVHMLMQDNDGRERAKALVRKKSVPSPMAEDDDDERELKDYSGPSRRSPSPPLVAPQPIRPFRDYDDEEAELESDGTRHLGDRDLLSHQQTMMNDQDERLDLLSHSINRHNDLSMQIGDELGRHHDLLEETDQAMDHTAARLNRARRRLDTVADGARQHGSTITIIALILILLFLIIIFKT